MGKGIGMRSKMLQVLLVVMFAGLAEAETWYKIGDDQSGKPSWYRSYDDTHGWATDRAATKTDRAMAVNDADDYVVAGKTLRTPGGNPTFNGKSLTLTENGYVLLKESSSKQDRTVTIPNLIVDGVGQVGNGTDYTVYRLAGAVDLKPGSTLKLSVGTNNDSKRDDYRYLHLVSAVKGAEDTVLDVVGGGFASNVARIWFDGSLEAFTGTVRSTSAGQVNVAPFSFYLCGPFNGQVESLPGTTRLIVLAHDKLLGGRGLRWASTTVPEFLKTTMVFYATDAEYDFLVDGLPLVTFPAGTEVDPASFTIRCRKDYVQEPDGTETVLNVRKRVEGDGSVALVVDASLPTSARIVQDGDESWTWRFFDAEGTDVTETCGLTAPNRFMKVNFETQAEFDRLKEMEFVSSGVQFVLASLTGDMNLTGMDFRIPGGSTVDLKGYHLALPGSVVAAPSDATKLTSTATGAVLEINVPEGESAAITKIEIAGGKNLRVWKTGLGRLTFSRANSFGEGDKDNTGVAPSLIVKEGVAAKTGKMSNSIGPIGVQYANIQVCEGAQFDLKGRDCWDYNYSIVGSGPDGTGALVSTTSYSNPQSGSDGTHFRHLYLDGDASVGGPVSWALNFNKNNGHNVTFRNHTLTLASESKLYWIGLYPKDSGTLVVNKGEVYQTSIAFSNVVVKVLKQLDSNSGHYFNPVKSLLFEPDATWTGYGTPATAATTVHETYRPSRTAMPSVTLGAEGHVTPTLDLSTQTATLDGTGLSFYEGATVSVDVGTRTLTGESKKLVSWTAKPAATVRFKMAEGGPSGSLAKRDDGLYYSPGLIVVVR